MNLQGWVDKVKNKQYSLKENTKLFQLLNN